MIDSTVWPQAVAEAPTLEINEERLNNWFTACVALKYNEKDPDKLRALVTKHGIRAYMMESDYTRGGVIVNCVDKKHRVLGQKAVSFFFK